MDDDSPAYSDEQIALALHRAAQLQLEAAARIERKPIAALAGDDTKLHRRADLVEAAREVGIGEEYVALALAELAPAGQQAVRVLDEHDERRAERWLGSRRHSVSVSHVVDAPPSTVIPIVMEVFESDEFRLKFAGNSGGAPTQGGLLVFEMERLGAMVARHGSYTQLCYRLEQLEAWTLRVAVRSAGERSELVIYADLRHGVVRNVRAAQIITGLFSSASAAIAGSMVAASAGALLAAFVGAAALVAVVPLSVVGYRALYRAALAAGVRELEKMLAAVSRRLARDALLAGASAPAPALPAAVEAAG